MVLVGRIKGVRVGSCLAVLVIALCTAFHVDASMEVVPLVLNRLQSSHIHGE